MTHFNSVGHKLNHPKVGWFPKSIAVVWAKCFRFVTKRFQPVTQYQKLLRFIQTEHINKLFFSKRHICNAQKAPRGVRLGMQTPRLTDVVNKTGPSAARDDKGGGTSIRFLFYSVASWSCEGVDEAGTAPTRG